MPLDCLSQCCQVSDAQHQDDHTDILVCPSPRGPPLEPNRMKVELNHADLVSESGVKVHPLDSFLTESNGRLSDNRMLMIMLLSYVTLVSDVSTLLAPC